MSGIVQLVVLLVVGAACAGFAFWWLRRQDRRARPLGFAAAGIAILVAFPGLVALVGVYRLNAPQSRSATNISAQVTSDQLLIANRRVAGCASCHSSSGNLPLDGGAGNLLADSPLGVLVGPNLTPGGPLKGWTDAEIIRAIREGVDRDGRPLLLMPSEAFRHLSDSDANALVAYLRSQPAQSHATAVRDISLVGLLLLGAGVLPTAAQAPVDGAQTAPAAAPTPEYGQYLVDITGCRTCHGGDLHGGVTNGFGPPAGPSLSAIAQVWPDGDFVRFFRTGSDPAGRQVDAAVMPWRDIGRAYTDDELRTMYAYLRTLQ